MVRLPFPEDDFPDGFLFAFGAGDEDIPAVEPALIVADEPTSALDADRRLDFVELLRRECESAGAALLFVSHDRALAGHFNRVVELPTLNAALSVG